MLLYYPVGEPLGAGLTSGTRVFSLCFFSFLFVFLIFLGLELGRASVSEKNPCESSGWPLNDCERMSPEPPIMEEFVTHLTKL